jgi:hypothetical protein
MDAIKRCASASIVEGLNNIGDFTQNFFSEGDARQLVHVRILANEFGRALIIWIRLTHVRTRNDQQR